MVLKEAAKVLALSEICRKIDKLRRRSADLYLSLLFEHSFDFFEQDASQQVF